MEYIEVSAKNVDDAITEASIQLGTTSDQIEYEVLEEEKSGILGLFSKPAKIRVRVKADEKDIAVEFLNNVFRAMDIEVKTEIKTQNMKE